MDLTGRTLLGKYRIEGPLGQGGMGTVWRGSHVVTGRKVAIKILAERFLANVNVVQRFGREARAASAIHHEGIVEVLDLDQTEEGLPFLVMEFLEGETLASRIERKKRLLQNDVVRIGAMLLDALEAAHQHGVIHRDLKPDNIYLVPAGRRGEIVKILDFGISHKDDEAQAKLTMTGSVLGTPHYMSPEQAMGETTLDRRVDIYGAGVVLYECLVGDVPFDAPNYNKLLRVILDAKPLPPSQRGAAVDPRIEALVLRALAKDRDERPQTAREMLDALRAAARAAGAPDPRSESRALPSPREPEARRAASASFAKPTDTSRTPTPTPRPAPITSGVRTRQDAPSSRELDLAVGGELDGVRSPPPSALAPPKVTPARAPLRLDSPSASTSLDALDDPVSSGSIPLELDERALPPRSSGISGQHRAISERAAERAISERSMAAARTPSPAPAPRDVRASALSHSRMPSLRASEPLPPSAPPHAPSSHPPSAAPAARGGWRALPEGARRGAVLGAIGLAIFVAVVIAVRAVVRPGESDEGPNVTEPASGNAAREPELGGTVVRDWVVIEIDGVPPSAELRLDGLPGATLPLRVRRGGAHVLEIRAPGYEDRRIEFTGDANRRIRADMRPAVGTTQER